jgi:beta-N-acetylhexosaminidase
LSVRAGQVVWPSVAGDQLTAAAQQYASWGVGGALLMTWPAGATGAQLKAFKQAGTVPLLISTDEEGGTVQRFRRVGVLPSAAKVASTMTPAQAEQLIAAHAAKLHALGVDVAFAPVVDVHPLEGQGPIGSRSFSSDPNVVNEYASAYVKAWESAGVLPVLKHFPGHGSASADSHTAEAVTPPLAELRKRDLLPYTALKNSGAGVMVGHLTVPGLTDAEGVPASMSKAAYDLLRHEYGYSDALVFTDALGMDAVARLFTIPQAAERALESGADVVIYTEPNVTPQVIAQLVAAVKAGRLAQSRLDAAVGRVLRAKHLDPCSL